MGGAERRPSLPLDHYLWVYGNILPKGRASINYKEKNLLWQGWGGSKRLEAILIVKISFLKARQRRAFKKLILVFPAPKALEIPKSVS